VSEFQLCMAALRRPLNYGKQAASSQWAIDKGLGILCPFQSMGMMEKDHPRFKEAKEAELQQVKAGNLNYKGLLG